MRVRVKGRRERADIAGGNQEAIIWNLFTFSRSWNEGWENDDKQTMKTESNDVHLARLVPRKFFPILRIDNLARPVRRRLQDQSLFDCH